MFGLPRPPNTRHRPSAPVLTGPADFAIGFGALAVMGGSRTGLVIWLLTKAGVPFRPSEITTGQLAGECDPLVELGGQSVEGAIPGGDKYGAAVRQQNGDSR